MNIQSTCRAAAAAALLLTSTAAFPVPTARDLRVNEVKGSPTATTARGRELQRRGTAMPTVNRKAKANDPEGWRVPMRLPGSNSVLGGAMVYNDLWGAVDENGNYLNPITAGVYSIQAKSGGKVSRLYSNTNMIKMRAGVKVNSIYYTISTSDYDSKAYLTTYYTGSWSQRSNEEIDIVNVPSDMTYDPVSGNVYGFFYNDESQEYDRFCRFDTYYGEAEDISNVDRNAFAIAANKNGEIYGIWGYTGWLIKIDPKTGRYEQIGKTGFSPAYINSLTFDDATGKLYWAANDAQGYSALMEVNTATGAATEVMHFENNASFAGLFAMDYKTPDKAPAAVTDAAVTFSTVGSLTGTVSCTAPTKTYNGGTLSGPLTVAIFVNDGQSFEIENVEPGATVTSEAITFKAGALSIEIVAATESLLGESVTIESWAGEDEPGAPTDVELTETADGRPHLSWKAPTKGKNGGAFDAAKLTYTITRYPDKATVTGVTATEWTDETFNGMSALRYEVRAVNDLGTSEAATSPTKVFGEGYSVPFTEGFASEADFNLWTVTDLNGGTTWEYDSKGKNIFYSYNKNVEMEGDDWIVSPRFKLEKDVMYALTFDSKTYYKNYPENFRFMLGSGTEPSTMKQTLIDVQNYENPAGYETKRVLFSVEESGYYHLGLYCYSIGHDWQLNIDNIGVAEVDSNVPGKVENMSVTAGAQGAMNAKVTLTAPTTDSKGRELSDAMTVNVYRNNGETAVHTFTGAAPGAALEWEDATMSEAGVYSYKAVAVNEAGEGEAAEASAFVGVDVPGAVLNLQAIERADGSVALSWTAPSAGANGGYFDPSTVTYTIVRSYDAETIAKELTATEFVDNTLKLKNQTLMYYLVTPYSGTAKGQYNNTPLNGVFGPALKAPISETFPGADIAYYPWVSESDGPNYLWSLETTGVNPTTGDQNGDGGLVMFVSNPALKGVTGEFSSPKIDVTGLERPTLTFWFYHSTGIGDGSDSEEMKLSIAADGGAFEPVEGAVYRRDNGTTGWKRYSVDLSGYKNTGWIRLMFTATSKGIANMLLDNITIDNSSSIDVAAGGLAGSKRTAAGVATTYTTTIANNGVDEAKDVKVTLADGDAVVATMEIATLAGGEMKSVEMPVTFAKAGKRTLTLTAAAEGDADATNNTASLDVEVVEPVIPVPVNVDGAESGDGTVTLTWDDPYSRGSVTDDVEDYEDWAITGIGDYRTIDLDGDNTYYINKDLENYPWMSSPKAFQVCNAKTLGINIWDQGKPHSGDKMLMSIAAMTTANNDWLVSPLLNGGEQTVSFYAKSFTTDDTPAERIRVLYSTTDTEASSFKPIHSAEYIELPEAWSEYRFVVPAGARYFAINCVSEGAFAMFVDDLTFNDMTVPVLTVAGYEVLRDGEVIGTTSDKTFTDASPKAGSAVYSIRAIYGDGSKSEPSAGFSLKFSGIADAEAAGVSVAAGDGEITVNGACGRAIAVYGTDGRLVATSREHGDIARLRVAGGFYTVKVGSLVVKVSVR